LAFLRELNRLRIDHARAHLRAICDLGFRVERLSGTNWYRLVRIQREGV
jgi:hypothetical protein